MAAAVKQLLCNTNLKVILQDFICDSLKSYLEKYQITDEHITHIIISCLDIFLELEKLCLVHVEKNL